jgi:hypothetical protein
LGEACGGLDACSLGIKLVEDTLMNRIATAGYTARLLSAKLGRTWLVLNCLLSPVLTARAANRTWTTATSGDFGAAGSWTGGVPGSADSATFDKVGTYAVTFDNTTFLYCRTLS